MLDRFSILQGLFGPFRGGASADHEAAARGAALAMGRRWRRAVQDCPQLRDDLIALGGIFRQPPVEMLNGMPSPGTQDLYQCGREDGRRELACQLLALSGLTIEELNQLTMENDQ